MTAREIADQLETIASVDDFVARTYDLVGLWTSKGVGPEAVESILHFMEEHPEIEFGVPGPLVHFVETFHGSVYDEKLIESVQRRPTSHTVWMLNRLINGTEAASDRKRLISVMEGTKQNPTAEKLAVQALDRYLERARLLDWT